MYAQMNLGAARISKDRQRSPGAPSRLDGMYASSSAGVGANTDYWVTAYCEKCHLDFYPAGVPMRDREERHQNGVSATSISFVPFWLTECGHIYCDEHLSREAKENLAVGDTIGKARCEVCRLAEVGVLQMSLNLPISVATFFCDSTEQSQNLFHALQFQQGRLRGLIKHLKTRLVAMERQLRKKDGELRSSLSQIALLEAQEASHSVSSPRRPVSTATLQRDSQIQAHKRLGPKDAVSQPAPHDAGAKLDTSYLTPQSRPLQVLSNQYRTPTPLVHARPWSHAKAAITDQSVPPSSSLRHRYSFRGQSVTRHGAPNHCLMAPRPSTADPFLSKVQTPARHASLEYADAKGTLQSLPMAITSKMARHASLATGARLLSSEAALQSSPSVATRPATRSTFRPASRLV